VWASRTNVPGQPASAAPSAATGAIQELLAAHNKYRAEVGAPPLQWSADLAASAKAWADHLASTGTFEHGGTDTGQNLWQGTSGFFSITQMVDGWGSEKQFYKVGTFPNVSTTGHWEDVGHYTQMIWKNTTQVGGAISSGNGNDVLVCHYNPAGNVLGQNVD
jgi:hypothetical protein